MAKQLKNTLHRHGCITCHDRYDDACATPAVNAQCLNCVTGRPVRMAILMLGQMPKDCCRVHCRRPTKDERERYSLAGDAPWFICSVCKLTHPFDDPSYSPDGVA